MWMDFLAISLLLLGALLFQNSLVDVPFKIVRAPETAEFIEKLSFKEDQDTVVRKDLLKRAVFVSIGPIFISFLIITAVYSQSFLGLIYFIFAILLIRNQLAFYLKADAP